MTRFLRNSCVNYGALAQNHKHNFALNHALNIYNSNAIYSFIPKNACSTMRTSLAYQNGCISDKSDFNWIHQNNLTFRANMADLAKAKYTFTILRCPFSRLASVYLDKIVDRYPVAWIYCDLLDRKVEIDSISFENFVKSMLSPRVKNGNPHWRSQSDFLVYKEYDDYFALEDFVSAVNIIKQKINLDVIDARSLTKHGADEYEKLESEGFSKLRPLDILNMKNDGVIPSHKSLYNDELVQIVSNVFKDDISLYKDVIGDDNLMFS